MDKVELKKRTQKFAVDIIKFIEPLPNSKVLNVLSNQLLRSSSSVGANYRAACKGKSTADFINKIVICEEEADESIYWIDLMIESELVNAALLTTLKKEATELTAIFTAIGKTAKENQRKIKLNKFEIEHSKFDIRRSINTVQ
ncbi:MAG: four helix bundle protein [Mucilaginibacter sp.]